MRGWCARATQKPGTSNFKRDAWRDARQNQSDGANAGHDTARGAMRPYVDTRCLCLTTLVCSPSQLDFRITTTSGEASEQNSQAFQSPHIFESSTNASSTASTPPT